ncbi:hypothetical protein METP3_00381 [Methanosarcinales archaeon]|nr:hypothetical protein METP3_00381 [Methanosarcinales archaeon]
MPKKRDINLFFMDMFEAQIKEISQTEKSTEIKDTLKSLRQKAEALGLTEEDVEKEIKAHRRKK